MDGSLACLLLDGRAGCDAAFHQLQLLIADGIQIALERGVAEQVGILPFAVPLLIQIERMAHQRRLLHCLRWLGFCHCWSASRKCRRLRCCAGLTAGACYAAWMRLRCGKAEGGLGRCACCLKLHSMTTLRDPQCKISEQVEIIRHVIHTLDVR